MTHIVFSWMTFNHEVTNSEKGLQRSTALNLTSDSYVLVPFTYKKTPHMTYIIFFWLTAILTSIDKVNKSKIDLQRPGPFNLTFYLDLS